MLVARRPSGWYVTYPLIETTQVDGTCRELVMPAIVAPDLEERATALAVSIADGIDAVGILAVELFVTDDGSLLVNEIATRPHNSGHATLDGAATSQFENHLRAVLDWPLGDTSPAGRSRRHGQPASVAPGRSISRRVADVLVDPSVHLHLYGKTWRPGRKLGHVTAVADTTEEALQSARGRRPGPGGDAMSTPRTHGDPKVGVIMGSDSDWSVAGEAVAALDELGIPFGGPRAVRPPHAARAARLRRRAPPIAACGSSSAPPAGPPTCPACWPRSRPCPSSACPCRSPGWTGSTRCCPSCRCPPASPSPPWPSAPGATPACSPPASSDRPTRRLRAALARPRRPDGRRHATAKDARVVGLAR